MSKTPCKRNRDGTINFVEGALDQHFGSSNVDIAVILAFTVLLCFVVVVVLFFVPVDVVASHISPFHCCLEVLLPHLD